MIHLDTDNPAYSFRHEVVALIPPPPNYIRLSEIAKALGQCGTYYVRHAVEELQWAYPGISIRRRKGVGHALQCTAHAWPTIEHCGLDYLKRLKVGRRNRV
jgi:hypothetical protein